MDDEDGCVHLRNFKTTIGVNPYRTIHSFFVFCTSVDALHSKLRCCYCYICGSPGPRLHSCMHCIFFGCYIGGQHLQEHAHAKKHYLAVDLTYGNILCFQCGDYVYDAELIQIAKQHRRKSAVILGLPRPYEAWQPTREEIELLKKHPRRLKFMSTSTDIGLGPRGLVNLGETCWMNSVIQALMHTPMLRNFFLADQHICQMQNSKLPLPDKTSECFVCEMAWLFQEFYSGKRTPLFLDRFLIMLWTQVKQLAGRKQQDAHEFFITFLNLLHSCNGGATTPSINGLDECTCIFHRVFTGSLQSDIVCQACLTVSTKIDPMLDISLELGSSSTVSSNSIPLTLVDCLEQFTRVEKLDQATPCKSCDEDKGFTKQLMIRKLPVVICIHVKRFESSRKVSTEVSFPTELDMTQFMAHHKSSGNNRKGNNAKVYQLNCLEDNRYSLFAVINHDGTMEIGHYIAYVRRMRDQWFKCNDHRITRANLNEVVGSEGYLLFYHKNTLEYE